MAFLRSNESTPLNGGGMGCGCAAGRLNGAAHLDAWSGISAAPTPSGLVFRFECTGGCAPLPAGQCRAVARRAVTDAIWFANNAASKLEATPVDADTVAKFRFFFGHNPSRPVPWANNQSSGSIVAHRFRMCAAALRGRGTLIRCGCPGATASVNARAFRSANRIELCPRFWTLSRTHRGGVLLHEMLHIIFPFFRHFRVPPHPDDPQERRRDNAHCYEAFALRVAGRTPEQGDITRCRARPA